MNRDVPVLFQRVSLFLRPPLSESFFFFRTFASVRPKFLQHELETGLFFFFFFFFFVVSFMGPRPYIVSEDAAAFVSIASPYDDLEAWKCLTLFALIVIRCFKAGDAARVLPPPFLLWVQRTTISTAAFFLF